MQAEAGEAANMVLIPCWQEQDPDDRCIPLLVDALLDTLSPLAPNADLRQHSAAVSQRVALQMQGTAQQPPSELLPREELLTNMVLGQAIAARGEDIFIAGSSSEEEEGQLSGRQALVLP